MSSSNRARIQPLRTPLRVFGERSVVSQRDIMSQGALQCAIDMDPKLKQKFDYFSKAFDRLSDGLKGTALDVHRDMFDRSADLDADHYSDSSSDSDVASDDEIVKHMSAKGNPTVIKAAKPAAAEPHAAEPPAAEPPLPPPPAEPESLPDAVPAPKRARRDFAWGPFKIAKVVSHGVQVGWGCTCSLHYSKDDVTICKKQLRYKGRGSEPILDDTECLRQLKRWLLAGLKIKPALDTCRVQHRDLPVRSLGPQSFPEDLDMEPTVPVEFA
jgi:hypothetical protein